MSLCGSGARYTNIPSQNRSYRAVCLAPGGVFQPRALLPKVVSPYLTVSLFAIPRGSPGAFGDLFSVELIHAPAIVHRHPAC